MINYLLGAITGLILGAIVCYASTPLEDSTRTTEPNCVETLNHQRMGVPTDGIKYWM